MKQGTANRKQLATRHLSVLALVLFGTASMCSQQIQLGDNRPAGAAQKQHVSLMTEVVEVHAGAQENVELQFRVDPGFHINSHTPKDELLIPTILKLDADPNVKLLSSDYPAGAAFKLGSGSASETLDVYQGEFRVHLRLAAQRGEATLTGTLHYQACDNAACFPPRSLPVRIIVEAQ